ncbi:MAG: hypothetical protein KDN20_02150 [Verrucomicrobiae bacterium]|nr:hypothetical protein [Verrucomicrobiae bacterium]
MDARSRSTAPTSSASATVTSSSTCGESDHRAKTNLGKVLFWDEQLSSSRTISYGTCHHPVTGGADPRSTIGDAISTNPGPDGISGTSDHITGSPGVILNWGDGLYDLDDYFGMTRQVTWPLRAVRDQRGIRQQPFLGWPGDNDFSRSHHQCGGHQFRGRLKARWKWLTKGEIGPRLKLESRDASRWQSQALFRQRWNSG